MKKRPDRNLVVFNVNYISNWIVIFLLISIRFSLFFYFLYSKREPVTVQRQPFKNFQFNIVLTNREKPFILEIFCSFYIVFNYLFKLPRDDFNIIKMVIANPSTPTHVMEPRDTFSTKIPPIPAPAAIDNCIIDWFSPRSTPDDSGFMVAKLNCCAGADAHAAKDHSISMIKTPT